MSARRFMEPTTDDNPGDESTIDNPPIDSTELTAYVFHDAHITGLNAGIRGGGTDKYAITFEGKGGHEWRALYGSGEQVAKGAPREFMLDSLVFDAVVPASEGKPSSLMQLRLGNRNLWAKVATGHTDDDGNTEISARVELSVYRHGGGFIQDSTGDATHDCGIMTPDLLLTINRIAGLQGSLVLTRAPEAQQGDLFEPEYADPCQAPEGVRERTLSRGKRPAVQAFESAVSATDATGNLVEIPAVRAFYDSTPDAILRTWDSGPVKVVVDHRTVYILAMPAGSDEMPPKSGKDIAGDQGED